MSANGSRCSRRISSMLSCPIAASRSHHAYVLAGVRSRRLHVIAPSDAFSLSGCGSIAMGGFTHRELNAELRHQAPQLSAILNCGYALELRDRKNDCIGWGCCRFHPSHRTGCFNQGPRVDAADRGVAAAIRSPAGLNANRNGRCGLHGGLSSGPKSSEGRQRSIESIHEGNRRWRERLRAGHFGMQHNETFQNSTTF